MFVQGTMHQMGVKIENRTNPLAATGDKYAMWPLPNYFGPLL